MNEIKLCKDCKWFRRAVPNCVHPGNMGDDLVNGGQKPIFAPTYLRSGHGNCGILAKWFEPEKKP